MHSAALPPLLVVGQELTSTGFLVSFFCDNPVTFPSLLLRRILDDVLRSKGPTAVAESTQGLALGLGVDLGVDPHGHIESGVPEEFLDTLGVGSASNQVGGEGAAEAVDIDVFHHPPF
jgi:hypothetical protein